MGREIEYSKTHAETIPIRQAAGAFIRRGRDDILRKAFAAIACMALLVCSQAFAEGKKVLFFESAVAPPDSTFSDEPSGFSKLVDTLTADGMLVASMSSGEINRRKLSPYEIVVIHPSPERPFGEREISALVWFVAQHGGSLFLHGGDARTVNSLTEIFGISMDRSKLVDMSSALEGGAGRRSFALTRFPPSTAPHFGFDEIQRIGFYGGAPLILSRDAAAVVTGDEDCFSDNGLYSIGSFPPVAAAAYLGRGVILVKSDRSILSNANIATEQNMEWARLVFRGLAAIQESGLEREESMIGLRARIAKLSKKQRTMVEQHLKNEADLAAQYEKIKKLRKEMKKSDSRNEELAEELGRITAEKDRLAANVSFYQNSNTLKIAAGVAGTLLLVVFLIGLLIGRRGVREKV